MAGVEAQLEAMRKKEAEELLASGGPMLALEATAARPTLALAFTLTVGGRGRACGPRSYAILP